MHSNKGILRIVGGKFRSRRLRVAARPGLRPTPDRVRETLFNWLGQELSGLDCLDLFAGSGALGFEAASRGAARVTMVEKDRVALEELERGRAARGAARVEILRGHAHPILAGATGGPVARALPRFDVVFLDPPFRQNALPALLSALAPRLKPAARVYIESDAPLEAAPPWTELRRARAGQVSYQLWRWDGHDQSGVPGHV